MIVLDYQDRRPLYEQITDKFRNLIMQGILEPETRMPSVRNLAVELSINPNTIQRAYARLEQMGLIYPVKGRGNFVSPNQELIRQKNLQLRQELTDVMVKGREQGMTRGGMISLLDQIYEGGQKDDSTE